MKYTLQYINETKFDQNRNRERRLSEIFIPLNWLGKKVSSYPAYVFLNLGIHADVITFMSILVILLGAYFVITSSLLLGAIFWLIFFLFDSVDGDVARCMGPTSYGGIIDSFGADFFYAFAPMSVSYYLFSIDFSLGFISAQYFVLIGALISILFLLYRLVNAKLYNFSNNKVGDQKYGQVIKEKLSEGLFVKIIRLYRHVLVKGNFFSEPGMILWFFIFAFFQLYQLLAIYLIIILAYNIGYLLINLVSSYTYFRGYEIRRKEQN